MFKFINKEPDDTMKNNHILTLEFNEPFIKSKTKRQFF